LIKPGDLVCVTRKCCEDGVDGFIGRVFAVTEITDGWCEECGRKEAGGVYYGIDDPSDPGFQWGFSLCELTKIDPLKEPETVEEEAHA
jgi:hypothetical protein